MLYPAELRARDRPYISPKSRGTRAARRLARLLLLLTILLPAGPTTAGETPTFRWSSPVEVTKTVEGPAFLLADGRTLLPGGIRLPERSRLAPSALLAEFAPGGALRLAEGPLLRDRYGRLLAQLADGGGEWLQGKLVRHGLAVVDPLTASAEIADALLAIEEEARRAAVGIWSPGGELPESADRVRPRPLRFTLVEGRPRRGASGRVFFYLNFGADRRRDFTVRIRTARLRDFRRAGLDPEALAGQRIRVRGWIFPAGGPMIEVTDRRQIEVLE